MAHAFVAPPPSPPNDRILRLRGRRIHIEAGSNNVSAWFTHGEEKIEGRILDLSHHGIATRLGPGTNRLIFAADRIENLEVETAGNCIYRGKGTIRRVAEDDEGIVLGIELDGNGLDLSEIYKADARSSFATRLQDFDQAASPFGSVQERFKAWVADFRSDLEGLRRFMDAEETALRDEDQFTRLENEREILDVIAPWLERKMLSRRAELGSMVTAFTDEEHELHRAYLKLHVGQLFGEAPFIRRAATKPLGYAGDYEMMNMLYRDPREGTSLFGKALNAYATTEDAARANINRIDFLGTMIRRAMEGSSQERFRLASIGCGPAREISALLHRHPELGARLEVALIDQDDRSIAYCERTLAPLARQTGARFLFVRESVRRLLTTHKLAQALGKRDLIYSAGLFDYLSDRSFVTLLSIAYEALAPGGRLLVGNVAAHNPTRWTMEYFLEWFLIHRSPDDLRSFAEGLQPIPASVSVEAEPSGVNLFLVIDR